MSGPAHVPAQPVEVVATIAADQTGPRHGGELPPLLLLGPLEQRVVDDHVAERVDAQEIAAGREAGEWVVFRSSGADRTPKMSRVMGGPIGENPLAPFTIRFQWLMDMKVK